MKLFFLAFKGVYPDRIVDPEEGVLWVGPEPKRDSIPQNAPTQRIEPKEVTARHGDGEYSGIDCEG